VSELLRDVRPEGRTQSAAPPPKLSKEDAPHPPRGRGARGRHPGREAGFALRHAHAPRRGGRSRGAARRRLEACAEAQTATTQAVPKRRPSASRTPGGGATTMTTTRNPRRARGPRPVPKSGWRVILMGVVGLLLIAGVSVGLIHWVRSENKPVEVVKTDTRPAPETRQPDRPSNWSRRRTTACRGSRRRSARPANRRS